MSYMVGSCSSLFYLTSFFVKFKNVAAMKIRSGYLALKVQNSTKNLPISMLRTEPQYKQEALLIHLYFKQTVVVRHLQDHQHHF